jgi:Putative beta-barrel porin 2
LSARWVQLGVGAALLAPAAVSDRCEAAPSVTVAPQATVTYDSNWARSSEELAELRGLKLADVRYAPELDVDTEMPVGRHVLFAHAEAGYDFFQRNTQLNRERLLGRGGARVAFSRCTSTLTGSFSRGQSSLADFVDVRVIKNVETVRSVGFEGRCGGPVGFVPLLSMNYASADNSAEILQLSDNDRFNVKGGIAYTRGSFGELSLIGEYTKVRYPHRLDLPDGLSDSYRSVSLGARYERKIGSQISGSVSLFRTTVRPAGGSGRFSGLTAKANLNWTPTPFIKTQLNLAREVQPASLAEADYILVNSLGLNAEYARGPRVSFTAGGGFDKRNLKGERDTAFFQIQSDRRRYAYLGATYRFNRIIALHGELRREIRNADIDDFDYTSNRAMLNLRLAF